jgi:hypothetical protein
MKKIFIVLPIVVALTACGTTDVYQKRADNVREYEEKAIDQALKKRPEWMSKLPISSSAVFAAAEGSADSYNMAVHMARTNALSDLCYSADGKISSQTKQFETGSSKTSNIEKVTRTNCNSVDVTGNETYGAKDIGENPLVIRTGNKFTAFVLLALPTGDANVQRKYKDGLKREERELAAKEQAFKELPKAN